MLLKTLASKKTYWKIDKALATDTIKKTLHTDNIARVQVARVPCWRMPSVWPLTWDARPWPGRPVALSVAVSHRPHFHWKDSEREGQCEPQDQEIASNLPPFTVEPPKPGGEGGRIPRSLERFGKRTRSHLDLATD